jgi:hypothetical protein
VDFAVIIGFLGSLRTGRTLERLFSYVSSIFMITANHGENNKKPFHRRSTQISADRTSFHRRGPRNRGAEGAKVAEKIIIIATERTESTEAKREKLFQPQMDADEHRLIPF